jgi:AcrR family transcriptional regulator
VRASRAKDEGDLTPRGARTKAALVDAARTVFERDGFLGARITDIAEEAGVAHGTFYTYFDDKESIFRAVAEQLHADFQVRPVRQPDDTPYDQIHRANRHYYDVYVSRGKLMGLLEQVATFSEEFRVMRRDLRRSWVDRAERSIRRWQAEGIADPDLDARYAASALGSMVDRSAYIWIVLEEPHDPEVAIETLSRLWANAVGLAVPARTARKPRSRRANAKS